MTQWQEFPRRPQGRPWPGINTRAGVLDDGSGQMQDESTNVMINEGDVLEKRNGLIRGLDEFFEGAVCGLHRYTDECGIEWLVVSDQAGIKVRQPFAVPVFEISDAYPSDSFSADGSIDPTRWLNRQDYQQLDGELRLRGVTAPNPLVWFKQAASSSYQLQIQFNFNALALGSQETYVILKAAGNTATGVRLQVKILYTNGSLSFGLFLIDATAGITNLLSGGGGTASTGFLTVSYNAMSRVASVEFFPTGEDPTIRDASPLTAIEDADLGQWSALQLVNAASDHGVLVISGGPV